MTSDSRTIDVAIGPKRLEGSLFLPQDPRGLIIFAHGSGSSRFSPRNRYVAERLLAQGFACLLFDLLTVEEGEYRRNVFDIHLLGGNGEALVRLRNFYVRALRPAAGVRDAALASDASQPG